jgi:hypothetical protein
MQVAVACLTRNFSAFYKAERLAVVLAGIEDSNLILMQL